MGASVGLAKGRWIRRGEDRWRELLAEYERSGQTQERFCAERALSLSTFTRWRQKLRRGASAAAVAGPEALFVELASDEPEARWDVELQLGAGVVLRLRRPPC